MAEQGDVEQRCFNASQNAEPIGTPRIGWAVVIATRTNTYTSTEEK
jgi:hypothetical protein